MSLDLTKKINRIVVDGSEVQIEGEKDRIDIGDFIGTIGGLWKVNTVQSGNIYNFTCFYLNFDKGNIEDVAFNEEVGATGIFTPITCMLSMPFEKEKIYLQGEYIIASAVEDGQKRYGIEIMSDWASDLWGEDISGLNYDPATNTLTNHAGIVLTKASTPILQDVTVNENGDVKAELGYDGLGVVTVDVASSGGGGEFFDRTFANNTPEQISKVSALIAYNNMTSAEVTETFGWNIGDTTKITLSTDEVVEMRIIGFNHDTRTDGGKAGLTLETTYCLATQYAMNETKTNNGGYPASKMRNTTLPTIKLLLPQEWQDVIKFVDKKSANGGSSNYSAIVTTSEGLFLLSEYELYGRTSQSKNGYEEGTVYQYWQGKTDAERIKDYGPKYDFGPTYRWLRSSSNQSTGQFCTVYKTGGTPNNLNAHDTAGVSFAFCV
jgi:hypothetical protein